MTKADCISQSQTTLLTEKPSTDNEIVMDWRGDETVACNLTELLKEERDLLARKKRDKQKAEKDTENLLGEYL